MQFVTATELHGRLKQSNDYVIVDIRESYEYEIGNLNSMHIPMGELLERQNELPVDKNIVIMCRSGRRAEPSTNLLSTEFNKTNIFILEGGIVAWKDSVEPSLNLD